MLATYSSCAQLTSARRARSRARRHARGVVHSRVVAQRIAPFGGTVDRVVEKPNEVTSTLSHIAHSRQRPSIPPQPHLFLVLQADSPLSSSTRCGLQEVTELTFGRAREGPTSRLEHIEGSRYRVTVPDRWMSSAHAILRKGPDHWVLEDLQSKNGTLVNGERCEREALDDGDLLELGHTFFIFREATAVAEGGRRTLHANELRPSAPGLATLIPELAEQFGRLDAVSPSLVSVIIEGESGTGKELVARAIHQLSGRAGDFIAVNCAALPQTLVESELFGYRKGAFSGATEDRTGLIRSADRGTLFLDEIGDLPPSAQAVFLRVLQESEVLPVGATRPVKVDIRLLAATHRDLEALIAENRFRGDLLARLSGLTLRLPPLRARREDLGLLIGMLLRRHFQSRAEQVSLTSEAARALLLYEWPLNIRELEKCLTTAVVLARDGVIQETHLPGPVRAAAHPSLSPKESTEEAGAEAEPIHLSEGDQRRREEVVTLLREHGGNITSVARALGKGRFQVQRWIKRFRIDPKKFRR